MLDILHYEMHLPLDQVNFAYPYLEYEATAGQINYFCGNAVKNSGGQLYCCCLKGTTVVDDICQWQGDSAKETACNAPSHITTPF